ncbi:hypothetical protein [Aestuariivirga sp.]|uniref:hypothetical protein n=1 Tax=Aestuariivirga sp. TaxID=2650926 RepID=UPI00391C2D0C
MSENLIRNHYSELWPPILEPWTRYLIACRTAFDGDLDKLVLLAAIATMSLAQARNAEASYDELKSGEKRIEPQLTNFLSLAEFTQIPRETVRRKTEDLIAKGLVIRSDKGLFVSQGAASELEDLSVMAFDLLMHIHGVIANGMVSAQTKQRRN